MFDYATLYSRVIYEVFLTMNFLYVVLFFIRQKYLKTKKIIDDRSRVFNYFIVGFALFMLISELFIRYTSCLTKLTHYLKIGQVNILKYRDSWWNNYLSNDDLYWKLAE
jgi:hypothetical protein